MGTGRKQRKLGPIRVLLQRAWIQFDQTFPITELPLHPGVLEQLRVLQGYSLTGVPDIRVPTSTFFPVDSFFASFDRVSGVVTVCFPGREGAFFFGGFKAASSFEQLLSDNRSEEH